MNSSGSISTQSCSSCPRYATSVSLKDDGSGKPSVLKRWRARGPKNDEFVELLQRGHRQVTQMLEKDLN